MQGLARLFEPVRLGRLELKNRIKMAPIGVGLGTPKGYVTNRMIAFWEERARGGVGFMSFPVMVMPGFVWGAGGILSLMDDDLISDAERLARAIHRYDVKVALSISHPGRRQSERNPEILAVAPSAIRHPLTGVLPKELSKDEIKELQKLWAQGARRVKAAGYDAVSIQGAHGYLIHQFLSPRTNKRTDEYGGSIENRARFACEIVTRIREEVGPDFPILIRMNGEDHLEGGITVEQAVQHARHFVKAGVDGIDISSGPRESHHWQFVGLYHSLGALVNAAAAIKKAVDVPVGTVGKIDPFLAEHILEEGSADIVSFGRSLIADPEWPNKVKEGRLEDIRPCIYCNHCLELLRSGSKQICAVNPAAGVELEYRVEAAHSAKKVMVIGGGLAGMEAARTLAERGHNVSLYERDGILGGQWNILSAFRPEVATLVEYLSKGLEKAGVEVLMNREVTPFLVEEHKPDAVVVATGAKPSMLDVPGVEGKNVMLATDVLMGKAYVGEEVVVIGGGLVGLDTALFLAEQGKKVSVVEQFKIAQEVSSPLKLTLIEKLVSNGVYMYPNSAPESITEKGVLVVSDGEIMFLRADTVILAVGSESENRIAERLKGFMEEVYAIGDGVEPRSALEAIHEGSEVGRKI